MANKERAVAFLTKGVSQRDASEIRTLYSSEKCSLNIFQKSCAVKSVFDTYI